MVVLEKNKMMYMKILLRKIFVLFHIFNILEDQVVLGFLDEPWAFRMFFHAVGGQKNCIPGNCLNITGTYSLMLSVEMNLLAKTWE